MKKCEYAKYCGNCSLMDIDYSEQLQLKKNYIYLFPNKQSNALYMIGMREHIKTFHRFQNKIFL